MNRRLAAGAAVATLALSACGSSTHAMTAKKAGAQWQADAVAAGIAGAQGIDADQVAFSAMAKRIEAQSWPSYAKADIHNIEARIALSSKHVADDDVTDADVDEQALGQDVDALAATLRAHGDPNAH